MNAPVRIDTIAANIPAEHQDILQLTRSSDDVAASAIANMRAMLHHSGPASRWQKLSKEARRMICFGAGLRPSDYADRDLDDMTTDERDAIRKSLVAIRETATAFGEGLLTRRDWLFVPDATAQQPSKRSPELEHKQSSLQSRLAALTSRG